MKVRVMCRKFECREDIHYKTQTSCEKCNSKDFHAAGNRTRVLWNTRPVLYRCATEAFADKLGASSVYTLMRW